MSGVNSSYLTSTGNRNAIAPAQLVLDADASAYDVQRFFLGLIALEQAASCGLADGLVE